MKNKMNWIDYVCAVFILFLLPYILHVLICSYFFLFDFFSPFYTHFVRKCRSVEVCVCKYKIVKSPPLPTRLTALFPSVCYFFHLALIIAIVPTLFRLAPFFVSSCVVCVPTRTLYFHTHRCWFDLTKWCFYVRVLIEYVRLFALSHYNKKKRISCIRKCCWWWWWCRRWHWNKFKKAYKWYIQESGRSEANSKSKSNDRMLLILLVYANCHCPAMALPFWILT